MNPFKTFDNILKPYLTDKALKELPIRWSENHRYYHNTGHLIQIIHDIETNMWFRELNAHEKRALLLAAFFHDVIYDPKAKDNEDQSINYFKNSFKINDPKMIKTVCDLIEVTKHRKRPFGKLQRIMWDADNSGFKKGYDVLLNNEKLIRKEYPFVSNKKYKEGRLEFLESCKGLFGELADKNLDKLIKFVEKTY